MAGFDMHIHSTASDGAVAPAMLVEQAQQRGLLGMALTDHDTVAGLAEAMAAGKRLQFTVIPGIEISAEWQEHDVHILGYWVNAEKLLAGGRLQEIEAARTQRIYETVRRLSLLGLSLDAEQILATAGASPGRPHIARAMIDAGYAASMKDAFGKWLNRGRPAYVPRLKLTPFEAIEMIRAADGAAVLAHPGCGVPDPFLQPLARAGLGGIEAYHPEHSRAMEKKYARFALYHRLAAFGGSDFHVSGPRELGTRVTTVGQLGKLAAFLNDEKGNSCI